LLIFKKPLKTYFCQPWFWFWSCNNGFAYITLILFDTFPGKKTDVSRTARPTFIKLLCIFHLAVVRAFCGGVAI